MKPTLIMSLCLGSCFFVSAIMRITCALLLKNSTSLKGSLHFSSQARCPMPNHVSGGIFEEVHVLWPFVKAAGFWPVRTLVISYWWSSVWIPLLFERVFVMVAAWLSCEPVMSDLLYVPLETQRRQGNKNYNKRFSARAPVRIPSSERSSIQCLNNNCESRELKFCTF